MHYSQSPIGPNPNAVIIVTVQVTQAHTNAHQLVVTGTW